MPSSLLCGALICVVWCPHPCLHSSIVGLQKRLTHLPYVLIVKSVLHYDDYSFVESVRGRVLDTSSQHHSAPSKGAWLPLHSPNRYAAGRCPTNAFNSLNRENALRNIQEGTTQGDPLAMAMNASGGLPLIHRLSTNVIEQVWYADDATACGKLSEIRSWWKHLVEIGPQYGYFPNASQTWMIVKKEKFEEAQAVFEGTSVNVTQEGTRYQGATLGTRTFTENFVSEKLLEWTKEIEVLSAFACYKMNEQEKKRAYEERVREIEHGSFAPLVVSTSEGASEARGPPITDQQT
ncbi:hypothetical protein EMCRGX_G031678 [Ephydatia muelleri]